MPTLLTQLSDDLIRLVMLDPGHFHAALIQKTMYPDVSPLVHLYAPEGQEVQWHLDRIKMYNSRATNPTRWEQINYFGTDFLNKMIAEKKGNVVVLAGNNRLKTAYILAAIQKGFNVLSDKPMAINASDFKTLQKAFREAAKNKCLLFDIMTERFEVTSMLQKDFSMTPSVFGTLVNGTADNPAITKESVHHFYKYVSGNVLVRPQWFLDVEQQGEGIVDVMTHLVDLVQWACFPNHKIDFKKDILINKARRWSTPLTLSEFKAITNAPSFPDYLKKYLTNDNLLNIYCNGEINYTIKGVHAKTSVIWRYKAPTGTADTHYSIMRGTKANLIIKQGLDEKYIPTLYIDPLSYTSDFGAVLQKVITDFQKKYPQLSFEKSGQLWKIIIPEALRTSHEDHFGQVTATYLKYLKQGAMPDWEVPNMLAKYYTTTQALTMALKNSKRIK